MNVRPRRRTTVDPTFCFNDLSELRTFMITFLSSYVRTAFDTLKFRPISGGTWNDRRESHPEPQRRRPAGPCPLDSPAEGSAAVRSVHDHLAFGAPRSSVNRAPGLRSPTLATRIASTDDG